VNVKSLPNFYKFINRRGIVLIFGGEGLAGDDKINNEKNLLKICIYVTLVIFNWLTIVKIISHLSIIFDFLLLLTGCNSVEPGESTIIDSTIRFKIYESFPETNNNNIGESKIYIYLFTEKEYPCLGYQLNLDEHIYEKNIDINIHDIIIPDGGCPTAFGPASCYLILDLSNGEYYLDIEVNRQVDRYLVKISDSEITIQDYTLNRISESLYHRYFRFPKFSFAYYCGTSIENKYICNDFLDTLQSKISIREFSFPGNGEKPYPDSLGGHNYEMAKYFLYDSETDFNKIGEILGEYKNEVLKNNEANISIYNWQNKHFYSWLY